MMHKRLGCVGVWALLALLMGSRAAPAAPLPTDLDAVPRDATGFIHLRAEAIWKSELAAELRLYVGKAGPQALKDFQKMFVPDPTDIERVTFVAVNTRAMSNLIPFQVDPENASGLVIVTTRKPFDRFQVTDKLGFRPKFYKRHLYYFNEDLWSGLVLLDDHTFLFGAEDSVVDYFDMAGPRSGPLQAALEEASKPHLGVLAWNPQPVAKNPNFRVVPANIQPLFKANCLVAAFDYDKHFKLDLRIEFADADQAAAGEKALQAAIDLARAGLMFPINQIEQELRKEPEKVTLADLPERFGYLFLVGFLRDLEDLLKNAKLETKGNKVYYPFEYGKSASAQQTSLLLLSGISLIGRSASATFSQVGSRIGTEKNPQEAHLKKVAEAFEKYHADKGHYPPPAILDKYGRPILSWRVAILPYLEGNEVYSQFNLEEPWDSLQNKKLLKKIPAWLQRPSYFGGESNTYWKSVDFMAIGPNSPFNGKTGPKRGDIDDKSVLLFFTEASEPASYWTKPSDLRYQPGQSLDHLFGNKNAKIHVLLKDGTFKSFSHKNQQEFRQLLEGKK